MIQKSMDWEKWTKSLYEASDGRIDHYHSMLTEDDAKAYYPNLYLYYTSGISPAEFLSDHLIVYEGGEFAVYLDPDNDERPDDKEQEQ